MILRRLLPIVLASVLVAGCLNVSTTLTVRPDGSGTVRERLTVPSQFARMMHSMKPTDDSTSSDGLFTEEEIRNDARSMNLRLESVQMISGADGEGYEAVYGFDNLNDVRFDPSPDEVLPEEASQQTDENPFQLLSAVEVSFTPGSPATLTIKMPRDETMDEEAPDDAPSTDSGGDEPSAQELKMMRQMLETAGVRLAVTVDGEIVETNATIRSGDTIPLVDMDFGELARDSTAFNQLMAVDQSSLSPQETMDRLNSVPGVTLESQETVTIRFR